MIGVAGVSGTLIGGAIADRWGARDARAYVSVPAAAALLGVPFAFAALLVPDARLALGLLAVPVLLKSFWYGPIFAAAQSLVQARSRATAAAVLLFIVNLIGLGIGPLAVGLLSDLLSARLGEAEGLRWAMALSSLVGLASMCCFLMARRSIHKEMVS
jgi:MFS family permease